MGTLQTTYNPGTESTVSMHSIDPNKELKYDEQIILSSQMQEVWLEEMDLNLYLLHGCEDMVWEIEAQGGCAKTLYLFLLASHSLIVFKQRDLRWEPAR